MTARVCVHGSLARSCLVCELQDRIAEVGRLRGRVDELETAIRHHRDSPAIPHSAAWDDQLEDLYALLGEETTDDR